MNNLFQIATGSILFYAVVVLLGGVMGYVKAKSKVSLFVGIGSGIALMSAWFLGRQMPIVGLGLASAISLILFVVFVLRFLRTRAFMPAGLMMVFSLAATTVFVLGLLANSGLIT
jgi:uncharacterized membrane protein (UPF0136 family)